MNIRFISAGAGSGKTYRLTEILGEKLTKGEIRPEAVVATTFTRKAAGELVERVRQHLIEHGRYTDANSMGQALIGTVNSVCGQLLQRYAFEAGLSPRLEVLAEDQQPVLFVQALDQAMTSKDIAAMTRIAKRLGITGWQEDVRRIIDLARANDLPPEALGDYAQRSTDELLAYFPKAVTANLDGQFTAAIRTANASIANNGDTTIATSKYLSMLSDAAHALQQQGGLPWSEWVRLSKARPAKRSSADAEPVIEIAARYDCHPQLHRDIAEWNHSLFDMAARAYGTYQALKAERGLMDFVDQEQQLLALLDKPLVAEALRDEIDLLLVDEFQDTSPIQLALFLKLAALANECIWVGDVKQAIYGFRGTDPELMRAVIDKLERDGTDIETLPNSWRSRPPLVDFANALFVPAFADVLEADQVHLDAKLSEQLDYPPVQFWTIEGSNADQRAAALAEAVTTLLESGIDVVDKETNTPRPLRLSDVAILSRTNKNAVDYASALTARGVSVSLEQPGLLATPEIHLTLACLRRLVDPTDTLASAEIVSLISATAPEAWLDDRMAWLDKGLESAQWALEGPSAVPALVSLEAMRDRLEFLAPSEVLDEALEAADVRRAAKMWGPTKGRSTQRLANLETLRGLAKAYEEACATQRVSATVGGMLLWLYDLAEAEADKKSGVLQGNAVQVLTHHGAKGLEWPVVISMDLETQIRGRLWQLNVVSDAAVVDMQAPLANRWLRYWPWPFGKQQTGIAVSDTIDATELANADRWREEAEAKRLLYVSFTRARDLLVLPLKANASQRPWLDTLAADWLGGEDNVLTTPDGTQIPCARERFGPPPQVGEVVADKTQTWFLPRSPVSPKLPAHVSPSKLEPVSTASIGRTLEIGPRLAVTGKPDMNVLGEALHRIYAAVLSDPSVTGDVAPLCDALLRRHGLAEVVEVEAVLEGVNRFQAGLNEAFALKRVLAEWPVAISLDNGQRMTGWIDVLVETDEGWVIVDHKSFPGKKSEWAEKALSYSGQLAAYRSAVERATQRPVVGQWIHFSVGGGLVEIQL